MVSPWNRIYPRFPWFFLIGRPLRFIGFIFSCLLFLGLLGLAFFGGIYALGRLGIGPMVAEAARDKDYWSIVLGLAVAGVFAWLVWRSLKKQFRNWAASLPYVEGAIHAINEEHDFTDGGLGDYLNVRVGKEDYILPYRLRKILKPGMNLRLLLWPGSLEVRAVWVAW